MTAAVAVPAVRPGVLAALAGLALVVLTGVQLASHGGPAVSRLELVGGLRHVDPQAVRNAVEPHFEAGFFGLDLDAVRRDVEILPWVAQARAERAWPSVVRVRVWELEPFARWRDGAFVDATGTLLAEPRAAMPIDLPRLAGPRGREREVIDMYRALAAGLAGTPFVVSALTLEDRGAWIGTTPAGLELRFGRGDPRAHIARLRGVVAKALVGRVSDVRYLDLRYSNGFAVGWREGSAAVPEERHG